LSANTLKALFGKPREIGSFVGEFCGGFQIEETPNVKLECALDEAPFRPSQKPAFQWARGRIVLNSIQIPRVELRQTDRRGLGGMRQKDLFQSFRLQN